MSPKTENRPETRPGMIYLEEAREQLDLEIDSHPLDAAYGPMTRTVHGGESDHSSAVPIYQGNTAGDIYAYTRFTNPTVQAFETKFRQLEGGVGSVATASGMAAVSQTLLGLLRHGDRLVVHREMFVGVRFLLEDFLGGYGIEIEEVDAKDLDEVARALEKPTALLFFEAVSHPFLGVVDVPAILELARRRGVLTLVDNTLLTPALLRPLDLGADLVVHSTTKYVGGHGDGMGGVVTARTPELAKRVRKARRVFGGILSPSVAYLLLRGLRTLPLRMERHCANAMEVARFLESHPRIRAVHYPGLPSSPQHAVARSFLGVFGGVVGFELDPSVHKERFGKALRLCQVRLSFGELATTVLLQDEISINRISVGLEDVEDILRDLDQALARA